MNIYEATDTELAEIECNKLLMTVGDNTFEKGVTIIYLEILRSGYTALYTTAAVLRFLVIVPLLNLKHILKNYVPPVQTD